MGRRAISGKHEIVAMMNDFGTRNPDWICSVVSLGLHRMSRIILIGRMSGFECIV